MSSKFGDFLIQRCFIYLDPDYAGLDTPALSVVVCRRSRSIQTYGLMVMLVMQNAEFRIQIQPRCSMRCWQCLHSASEFRIIFCISARVHVGGGDPRGTNST